MPCCCSGVDTGTEFQFWGELNDFSLWQHEEFHEPRLDLSPPARRPASSDRRDVTRSGSESRISRRTNLSPQQVLAFVNLLQMLTDFWVLGASLFSDVSYIFCRYQPDTSAVSWIAEVLCLKASDKSVTGPISVL